MDITNLRDPETWRVVEDNLFGYAGSESLASFRRIFPRQDPEELPARKGMHSGFTRTVLHLNDSGVDFRTAQWAAGQATCRLPQDASYSEILKLATEILEARHAA